MKILRHSYQVYKDTRDCLTKKVINKAMYIILNEKRKPLVDADGSLLIFYKNRRAVDYITANKRRDQDWRIKRVQLDVTTL